MNVLVVAALGITGSVGFVLGALMGSTRSRDADTEFTARRAYAVGWVDAESVHKVQRSIPIPPLRSGR